MSYNFKDVMNKPERLAGGHRMCAGCGGTIAVRNVLRGLRSCSNRKCNRMFRSFYFYVSLYSMEGFFYT